MDEFIYIGKIVNTHGIRGELRLLSDFDRKDKVFIPGMTFYIGRKKEEVEVTSYRKHKNFDMVCFKEYNDINQVLRFKGLYAYVLRKDLKLDADELLEEDYIGMEAISGDKSLGIVSGIENRGRGNKLFVIEENSKKKFIPFRKEFIERVDVSNKKIYFQLIEGLF